MRVCIVREEHQSLSTPLTVTIATALVGNQQSTTMIPLYPPHVSSPPAFGRPRWRSLVQLITPTYSRRTSFDLREGDHGDYRQRRPSAPAVLHDLRKILPGYVHRRYHSSSVLLQSTTEEEELAGEAGESVTGGQSNKTIGAVPFSTRRRRQSLSQLFLPLVSLQPSRQHCGASTPTAEQLPIAGGGARFKCKRIKAARETGSRPEVEQGGDSAHTSHHLFKSKAKDSSRGFWQPHRKVSSVSLAAATATPLVVEQHIQEANSQPKADKKHSLGDGIGGFFNPTTSSHNQAFSTFSSYVRLGGNENWPASTFSATSLFTQQQQQGSEQTNKPDLQKEESGRQSISLDQQQPPVYRKEGIYNPRTVFQQHRSFFAKLLEEHKSKLGSSNNPQKVSSAAEVLTQSRESTIDEGQPLPQQEDFVEVTVVTAEEHQEDCFQVLPSESTPLQQPQQITNLSSPSSNTALENNTTSSLPKSPQTSGELDFPLDQVVVVEESTHSLPPSPQSYSYLEDNKSPEEVFQKASTSANDDSSASNCGCGRFLLTTDQRRRHRHRSDSISNPYRPALGVTTTSSRSGSSSVKVVSTRTKVKLFSEDFSGPSSSPPSPCPRRSRRRGVVVEEPNDSLYIRRHTIPDMTVAAYGMVICGTDEQHRYRGRIEKVKFGVPISEAFVHDIPATLLVLLLKVNKEGPLKKDIWRAPGNQAQVRKLSHIMQHGRLVNISNISVYTAASVIKKFLAKLPGGIFGVENEKQLFSIMQQADDEAQRQVFCRVICSLSVPSQHLLVLLFGTFRIITDSAETFATRMTPDAVGISVAPSLFHTCIHDGQRAKLEDVMRFKMASQVISKIIQGFGYTNLFPRECYEFYARITGRTLRVDEHWHFTFQYPSRTFSQPSIRCSSQSPQPTTSRAAAAQASAASEECEDEDVYGESLPELSHYARVIHRQGGRTQSRSLDDPAGGMIGHRLSTSMSEVVVHSEDEGMSSSSTRASHSRGQYLESTRSLTYLEYVHEKQTRRMHTRSEWFLSPPAMPAKNNGASKSAEFPGGRFSSPMRLKLPKQEEDMMASPGDEDMRSVFGGQAPSTSSSMKCSPRPPSTSTGDSKMSVEAASKDPPSPEPISPLSRKPFQLLQQRHYSSTEGSDSATPPASAGAAPDVMTRTFFGLTDQLAVSQQPPANVCSKGGPSEEGSSSSGASTVATAIAAIGLQGCGEVSARVCSEVVRRRSWRTHYIRPNKSLEYESGIVREEVAASSQSTPMRHSPSSIRRRNSGPNGGGGSTAGNMGSGAATTITTLIRRKSSGNGGATSTKSKTAVQPRKSTQQ